MEDVGITLGMAVAQAVGDKKGLTRYGHAYVPLDEALSRVVVDFSGRPGLHMDVPFKAGMVGGFDTQLTYEFFQGFANHALVTLHIDNLKGDNAHHQCRDGVQGLRPRAAHGAGDRCALGRRDPVDRGAASEMSRTVAVVDYGMGNLRSVSQAVMHVADGSGFEVIVTSRRKKCSRPSASCCRGRARCPTACASCATPACRRPCSTPPRASR